LILRERGCVADCVFTGLARQAQFVLRGRTDVAQAASSTLGLDLALPACRSVQRNGLAALWLGPEEWLLLGPCDEQTTISEMLKSALASMPHALVDVSHRDAAFLVRGPTAALAINAGCPLDLRLAAFPAGACTRTLLGKAEIVLWRLTPDEFQIRTPRSFAAYVRDFLDLAFRDAV
jgi:sarcosine oxidase subunit gamma